MPMAKRGGSRRVSSRENTSRSSTPRVKTYSVSSLLGELDETPDEDIRRVSVEELLEMERRGETIKTPPDAPEIELDESFWENARLQPALFPREGAEAGKTSVHLRVDQDVFDWFKSQGKGHLTRMNAVLRAYYEANRK